MLKRTSSRSRSGVILLIVIAMLALFAAVGLAFVYYADNEAAISKIAREAESTNRFDVDPELLLAYFLGQFIYDSADTIDPAFPNGLNSAMRGHSLARNMYGYDKNSPNPQTNPFNGSGRLNYLLGTTPVLDAFNVVNYTYYPADGFLLDPERLGARANPAAPLTAPFAGSNVPYTYPDQQNPFLGAIKGNGDIVAPSWRNIAGPSGAPSDKYYSFRPDPKVHYYFGLSTSPSDPGGDVKNVEFGKSPVGTCDSIWMDGGFPIMIGPDGRKFKPLFASFITDLDGKLNINANGNLRANGTSHASNMGLGPWEINPFQVLNKADAINLFRPVPGRYGSFGQPGTAGASAAPLVNARMPAYFGAVDSDGVQDTTSAPSAKFLLPGQGGNPNVPYFGFPSFPSSYGTYGKSTLAAFELANHPSLFDVFHPKVNSLDDRVFAAWNMEALLRYHGTGSPSLGSDLFRMSPLNFVQPRTRGMLTTHSMDVGLPGASPVLPLLPAGSYQLTTGAGVPTYPIATGPPPSPVPPTSPGTGEFAFPAGVGPTWSYFRGALRRINLNRPLADYPAPDATTGRIATDATTMGLYQQAQSQRQALAQDIFNQLRLVTTGARPTDPMPTKTALPKDFAAVRWLAQLAVNIVDFRDSDDYITPFNWYTPAPPSLDPPEYVYGTELPRLVLNEVYAEVANDAADIMTPPADLNATKDYKVSFWVELLNPLQADPALLDNGAVRLQSGDGSYPIYKVTIAIPPVKASPFTDPALGTPDVANVKAEVANFTPAIAPAKQPVTGVDYKMVSTADKNYSGTLASNTGFYVLGPVDDFPGVDPLATLRVQSGMSTTIPKGTPKTGFSKYDIFLRRLATPGLPEQSDVTLIASKGYYNPYVTVDYVRNIAPWDGVTYATTGKSPPDDQDPIQSRLSTGRKQPYAADRSQFLVQQPNPVIKNAPQHTLFRHNAVESTAPPVAGPAQTLKIPFDWLVHLNRDFVSPIELLQVSQFPPHHLTQRFVTHTGGVDVPFSHISKPAWYDNDARIYRALEFFDTGIRPVSTDIYGRDSNLFGGKAEHPGRVAGKLNINTVWDPEVLMALCDPQPGVSSFSANDVRSLFKSLKNSAKPFRGMASRNVGDTLLRPLDPLATGGTSQRLLELPLLNVPATPPHPFVQAELMSKIFNNVTTRSNVFAIWVTVGFFEVTDGQVTTVSSIAGTTVTPLAMSGNTSGTPWAIVPGCCVWVGSEPVVVTGTTGGSFSANFTQAHGPGEPIMMKGVLGAEVGRSEGRNIRHRMFAVVDRTALSIPRDLTDPGNKVPVQFLNMSSVSSAPPTYTYLISLTDVKGTASSNFPNTTSPKGPTTSIDYPWQFRPGMVLNIVADPSGASQSTMTIAPGGVDPTAKTITVTINSPGGAPPAYGPTARIWLPGVPGVVPGSIMGNPGPQPRFDPRKNSAIVLHSSVIQ